MFGKWTVIASLFLLLAYYYGKNGGNGSEEKKEGKIVETNSGSVKGIISLSREGKEFYEWLGIPYATAERFETPKPVQKWSRVKDASEYGPICAQLEMFTGAYMGSEDCLYLNIHAPKNIDQGKRHPVLFWIHGGYFMAGSSNQYKPNYFFDEDNIVIVTINYRLGALGFLSTGDKVVRGNMGLKDQVLALKWTKENIAKFGGDDKNIVIFGESAGGASTHYHMLSPMSRGLMSKVISQSGTVLNPWALYEEPKKQAQQFAKNFNCPDTQDSQKLVDCLKKIELADFVQAHRSGLGVFRTKINVFVPTVEKVIDSETFLAEEPTKLLKTGQYSKLPWMTGFLSGEGLLMSHTFLNNATFRSEMTRDPNPFLESFVMLTAAEREKHGQKILDFYFGPNAHLDDPENFQKATNLIGDPLWVVSGVDAATLQSAHSPVYLYYYTKQGPSLFDLLAAIKKELPAIAEVIIYRLKNWFKTQVLGLPKPNYGSCHADELAMLFHMPNLFHIPKEDANLQFSKDMVKLWISFAHDETSMSFRNQKFTQFDPKQQKSLKYFQIDDDAGVKEADKKMVDMIQFWREIRKN